MTKKIQIILISVLSIAFIGIIFVVVWFFVLPKTNLLTPSGQIPEPEVMPTETKPITAEMIQQNKDFTKTIFKANVNNDIAECASLTVEQDRISCEDNYYQNQARKESDSTFCANIKAEGAKNSCYFDSAAQLNDSRICDNITLSVSKEECKSKVGENLGIKNLDVKYCQIYTDSSARFCYTEILQRTRDYKSCSTAQNENLCLAVYYELEASRTGDFSLCDKINDPAEMANCKEENSVSGDADNDGLNDLDEIYYGTDPLNPDTDKDGFKDGDEVKNGYNPLGAGKLAR